jgi:four helix bundle protein
MTQYDTLKQRTFDFAVAVFKQCRPLARYAESRVPANQIIRSSTGVAANYRAACRARSRPEFIAKVGTVIEEADESLFCLEFLQAVDLAGGPALKKLQTEANELVASFTSSQKTARANEARQPALRSTPISNSQSLSIQHSAFSTSPISDSTRRSRQ